MARMTSELTFGELRLTEGLVNAAAFRSHPGIEGWSATALSRQWRAWRPLTRASVRLFCSRVSLLSPLWQSLGASSWLARCGPSPAAAPLARGSCTGCSSVQNPCRRMVLAVKWGCIIGIAQICVVREHSATCWVELDACALLEEDSDSVP